ncbi:MAG: hypothetical protein N2595_00505 [bacterium]|nr:hypothetical protein [bacterium]
MTIVLAFSLVPLQSDAASLEWSVNLGNGLVMQLIADGSGGCAVVVERSGPSFDVIWFDNKGTVRYQATLSNWPVLLACEKKGLVYVHSTGMQYVAVSVDKKGVATTITTPVEMHLDTAALSYDRFVMRRSDSKGFFVERWDLVSWYLQRYSF